MRFESFLCLGTIEVSNHARVAAYVNYAGISGLTMPTSCACSALDTGFLSPIIDPAPWYEPTRPESSDFLGFYASDITLQPVASRNVAEGGRTGSVLSPLRHKGRILQIAGLMTATSAEGMSYGEEWLTEVTRGTPCGEGGCPTDTATILPACPEDPSYDADRYFRSLVDVGLLDGPAFVQVQSLPDHKVQQASFILQSSMPYLYHPADRCLDDEILANYYGEPLACTLTTPEWMGDGTFVIDITNIGNVTIDDLIIKGRISLDGTCPVSVPASSVPPSFTYTIPTLPREDRIVIDGRRMKAEYYDASCKTPTSALPYIDWDGAFPWPDVGPCTTMCLTIESSSGEASVTVDTYLRGIR